MRSVATTVPTINDTEMIMYAITGVTRETIIGPGGQITDVVIIDAMITDALTIAATITGRAGIIIGRAAHIIVLTGLIIGMQNVTMVASTPRIVAMSVLASTLAHPDIAASVGPRVPTASIALFTGAIMGIATEPSVGGLKSKAGTMVTGNW